LTLIDVLIFIDIKQFVTKLLEGVPICATYAVLLESRCALIKDVGSDVYKHLYRPEPL
jgi:hypothetical protein